MGDLTKPTIHRNGSAAKVLLDGYTGAARAIRKAMDALAATYPNGRDYYPQGEGVINRATREHEARMAHLSAVYDELQALAEHVADHE
jgi:hypothetical protein